MGSKEAPLGNVSAKTYLLKAILKVIKKIKFSRRKPEAFFPIQTCKRNCTNTHPKAAGLLQSYMNKQHGYVGKSHSTEDTPNNQPEQGFSLTKLQKQDMRRPRFTWFCSCVSEKAGPGTSLTETSNPLTAFSPQCGVSHLA